MRVSPRARRVRLVMKADGALEVVVPRRFDKRAVPGIVESKRNWVERTRSKLEARREELPAESMDGVELLPGRGEVVVVQPLAGTQHEEAAHVPKV